MVSCDIWQRFIPTGHSAVNGGGLRVETWRDSVNWQLPVETTRLARLSGAQQVTFSGFSRLTIETMKDASHARLCVKGGKRKTPS